MIFIFSQILILAYKNRKTYDTANKLSSELSNLNKNLEFEVLKRTEEVELQRNQISEQTIELAALNDKLKELDEAKNRFFANISHELRTPLTLILGGVSQARKELDPEVIGVDIVEKQANVLHQLIDQLLDLTKLEAGKMNLESTAQPIVKIFKEMLCSFQSLTEMKDITLQFESNVEECYAYVDRKAIERIGYNLLSNAYKFTLEGGEISMNIIVGEQDFQLIVIDSGIGISSEELPLIFDRFHQANTSLQKVYQGTGIGLALVKELVALHNGRIEVESAVGEGTQFTLTFPLQLANDQEVMYMSNDQQLLPPEASENDASYLVSDDSNDSPSVLIVEDHPQLLNLIAESLQEDYQIMKAHNGLQGVEMALEHIPDIIISDVMMPHKNGYELCGELKQDERTSHIPIILLTAWNEKENKRQGLTVGADDYLGKPFDADELQIRVKNLIGNRKLVQERFSNQKNVDLSDPRSIVFENLADQGFIERLFEVFEKNLSNEKFGVPEISESLAISRRQLHRKVTAISGMPPIQLLQNYRLGKAKLLLKNPDVQIKEVAFQVGFTNPSYFNKCFKEYFEMTPKAVQKAYQQ